MRRAHGRAILGQRLLLLGLALETRQAEIAELGRAALVDQDVVRFDVAVQDAPLVRVRQGFGDGHADAHHLRLRQTAGTDQRLGTRALDKFHGEEVDAACLADIDAPDDIGMAQLRGCVGLANEPLDEHRLLGETRRQDLDRDDAFHRDLARFENRAHATLPDAFEQLEIPDGARLNHGILVATPCSCTAVSNAYTRWMPRVHDQQRAGRTGLAQPARRSGPCRPLGSVHR